MTGKVEQICQVCGSNVGFVRSDDGFFYCGYCNSQADDIFDTGIDDEQFFSHYSASCSRVRPTNVIAAEPISQVKLTTSQYLDHPDNSVNEIGDTFADEYGPTGPSDFGSSRKNISYDEYYSEIRSRYVAGLQIMIQSQCQALVEKFNVSPLIIGLVGPLWLRFLASTRTMADDWADQVIHDSETQTKGEDEEFQPSAKYRTEHVNIHGKRLVYIWYRSLRDSLPIYCSLVISFLACHIAREGITPFDMFQWTLEGKLPYFAAFIEIEKQLGSHSEACPIQVNYMFRPNHAVSLQKLESMAADIAKKIGLELPPVNFYAIASCYCRQLSLPTKDVLPLACRVCEWAMPSELYLSANESRIPTRACVMSILIVTLRILHDINGYGIWESSLDNSSGSTYQVKNEVISSWYDSTDGDLSPLGTNLDAYDSRSGALEVLQILEAKYEELDYIPAYYCNLLSYLQYCKEVVFSGLQPSYEDLEEEKLLDSFWEFYQKNKPAGTSDNHGIYFSETSGLRSKRSRDANGSIQEEAKKNSVNRSPSGRKTSYSSDMHQASESDHSQDPAPCSRPSNESLKDKAIRQLKVDMEENNFCYIPPRLKIKNRDYIHYSRKRKDVYIYAVHADYYIILRSCAKLARVETRIMHIAVLSLERRLQWLEKRIGSLCHLKNELIQTSGCDPMDVTS